MLVIGGAGSEGCQDSRPDPQVCLLKIEPSPFLGGVEEREGL